MADTMSRRVAALPITISDDDGDDDEVPSRGGARQHAPSSSSRNSLDVSAYTNPGRRGTVPKTVGMNASVFHHNSKSKGSPTIPLLGPREPASPSSPYGRGGHRSQHSHGSVQSEHRHEPHRSPDRGQQRSMSVDARRIDKHESGYRHNRVVPSPGASPLSSRSQEEVELHRVSHSPPAPMVRQDSRIMPPLDTFMSLAWRR